MMEIVSLEKALQTKLDRLIESRLDSIREELTREVQGEIATALAGVPQSVPRSGTSASSPVLEELNQCISYILHPTGQSEIMSACLQAAAGFSGRCVLFARRGDAYTFWRAERFPEEAVGQLRSFSVPTSQPGAFREITETQQAVSHPRVAGALPVILDQALGACVGDSLHLIPIVVQGRVVAALYADSGVVPGSVESSAALEILARVTGLSLETAATRAAIVNRPGETAPPATAAEEQKEPELAAPPAELPEAGLDSESQSGPPPGSFAASIPAAPDGGSSISPLPDTESLPEEDRNAHRKAHRFARVAVQDLLSYHRSKIEQGRKEKNLYLLLKDDIEKTRENYRRRFGQTPARSFDYLHYELVQKLAGNDPMVLGDQYPGACAGE